MLIVTIEDADFPHLLEALRGARPLGRCLKNGEALIISITEKFVLLSSGDSPIKIAVTPARGMINAEQLARELLVREREQGHQVEFDSSENIASKTPQE